MDVEEERAKLTVEKDLFEVNPEIEIMKIHYYPHSRYNKKIYFYKLINIFTYDNYIIYDCKRINIYNKYHNTSLPLRSSGKLKR